MKSLELLFRNLLTDASKLCSTTTTRDINYVARRSKHEGLSFFTITLSDFCDDFERGLRDGQLAQGSFRSFRKTGLIPKFLSGIVRQVFLEDGRLMDEPSIQAISTVRQICRFAKKVLVPASEEKTRATYRKFIHNDNSLRDGGYNTLSKSDKDLFKDISRRLWTCLESLEMCTPRHGPGAVAERLTSNQKWDFNYWYTRFQPFFPYDSHAVSRPDLVLEKDWEELSPGAEKPVRVISVPKTQKGPRIIAIEPVAVQYVQQSVTKALMRFLEDENYLTRRKINFSNQEINAKLALEASRTGKYATLDLSDASDLVSSKIVRDMLMSCPTFKGYVFAARSSRADVPGHGVIHLRKYASMGSALCFPIESMVFYTIILFCLVKSGRLPLSDVGVRSVPDVWVYGDDLIVPVESASLVASTLSQFGMKCNTAKSFWTGKFRESCGTDAYDGVEVTPVYLRRMLPTTRRDIRSLVSAVHTGNFLYERGYFRTADYVRRIVNSLYAIPSVSDDSETAYVSFKYGVSPDKIETRWNASLHIREVKALVLVKRSVDDPINEDQQLLKYFVHGRLWSEHDNLRSSSSGSYAIKTRWCSRHSYGVR